MAIKGKGWKNESRRHSLARKGIRTTDNSMSGVRVDESSGLWFESQGVVSEMVSLVQLIGFDDLIKEKKASGISRDQYEADGEKIIVFPSEESKKTVKWLLNEYINGDRKRRKQVKRMLNIAIKEIDRRLGKENIIDIRVDLHKSRKMFRELEQELS